MAYRLSAFCFAALLALNTSAAADPALFAVSDEDTTVYVLGTVHLLRADEDWRTDQIDEALARSDAVYFEADVHDAEPGELQTLVFSLGMLPAGSDLSALLPGDDWIAVATYAASVGLPADAMLPMQPWFAAITLTTFAAMGEGLDPGAGVESALYTDLSQSGTERRYFETVDEQMRFLADMPLDIQLKLLMETVADADESADTLDELVAAWRDGNMDRLDALANGSMRDAFPEVYDAVILRRNRNWADELTELMETPGTFFVAVGAAHLPGDEGLLNLMRGEGYTVARQ